MSLNWGFMISRYLHFIAVNFNGAGPPSPSMKEGVPMVVVDGTALVATMGATVAAAIGVMVLKMDFCGDEPETSCKSKNQSPK